MVGRGRQLTEAGISSTGGPLAGSASRKGAERYRAILDAAIRLYADAGFRGTGLTAIGKAAGVSHATVLYHFGSTRNLLLQVMAERDRRVRDHLVGLLDGDGLDALRKLPEVARWNVEHPGLARLHLVLEVENLDEGTDLHAYFIRRREAVHSVLCEHLREGQRRHEVRDDLDVGTTADEIIAFMEGAQIQQFLAPDGRDLVTLYERYTESLLRDVAAR